MACLFSNGCSCTDWLSWLVIAGAIKYLVGRTETTLQPDIDRDDVQTTVLSTLEELWFMKLVIYQRSQWIERYQDEFSAEMLSILYEVRGTPCLIVSPSRSSSVSVTLTKLFCCFWYKIRNSVSLCFGDPVSISPNFVWLQQFSSSDPVFWWSRFDLTKSWNPWKDTVLAAQKFSFGML